MQNVPYTSNALYLHFVVNILDFQGGCNVPQEGERTESASLRSPDSVTLPFVAGVMSAESRHREEALPVSRFSP